MTDSSAKIELFLDGFGTKRWKNKAGKYHRPDGPAVEYSNGTKYWFIEGKLHREDGPACEYVDGTKEWLIDGKYHRPDGPAVEYPNGDKSWFINGKRHSEAEYNALRCSICAKIDCPTKN